MAQICTRKVGCIVLSYRIQVDRVLEEELRAEFVDRLNYVSKEIEKVEFLNEPIIEIVLKKESEVEKEKIHKMITRFFKSYKNFKSKIFYDNDVEVINKKDIWDDLIEENLVFKEDNGIVAISGVCLELLDFFSKEFRRIGEELGAVEYRYPTLISIKTMQDLKYLSSRPESLNFVSRLKEDINLIDDFSLKAKTIDSDINMIELGDHFQTDMINSSAVCFHTYRQYKGKELKLTDKPVLIGAQGKCFRYESKSMKKLERLRDFSMREIICLGTEQMVLDFIQVVTEKLKEFFDNIGMNYFMASANDPFFVEEFSIQSSFQRTFGLKTEINARLLSENSSIAIGSINNHKQYLGKSFGITNDGKTISSSCAAFGLERCVYAFLSQYGLDKSKWPNEVKKTFI